MRKWIKRALVLTAALPAFALCLWYALSFLNHVGELKAIAERGNKSVASVERVLYSLAVAGETKEGLRSYALRQAYASLVFDENPSSMLSRRANDALWYFASNLHLRDQQVFGLWVECALYGCGRGLKEAAREYFGKELHNLSERELAGLVALVKSPSIFKPGSERGEQRTNEILEKVRTQDRE